MCLVDLWLDGGCASKPEKKSKGVSASPKPMSLEFSDPGSRTPDGTNRHLSGKNAELLDRPENRGDLKKIDDHRVRNHPSPSSSFLFDWLPRKNEHKNLAELMEMEQTVWDKIEASGSKPLLPLDANGVDLMFDGEESRNRSNRSSVSLSLIRRDGADEKVAIEMDF